MIPRVLLLIAFAGAPLAAQNWVTNGDFNAGLSGWTQTGYSYNPTLETYDTAGTGASPCFACSPGGGPLAPPSTLDQSVLLVPTLTYELSIDVACTALSGAAARTDAVTVAAAVNGSDLATVTFDIASAFAPHDWHARLCARFVSTATGPAPLSVKLSRPFVGTATTQRVRIDNVSLQVVTGPTFNIDGSRRVGRLVPLRVEGGAGAAYAAFCAASPLPAGLALPGIQGLWFLDPTTTVPLLAGTLDAGGKAGATFSVPNDPLLALAPLWFQAAEVFGGSARIGFHHGMALTR